MHFSTAAGTFVVMAPREYHGGMSLEVAHVRGHIDSSSMSSASSVVADSRVPAGMVRDEKWNALLKC